MLKGLKGQRSMHMGGGAIISAAGTYTTVATMDSLWTEFRSAPTAYLQSHRLTMDTLVTSMIQVNIIQVGRTMRVHSLGYWLSPVAI